MSQVLSKNTTIVDSKTKKAGGKPAAKTSPLNRSQTIKQPSTLSVTENKSPGLKSVGSRKKSTIIAAVDPQLAIPPMILSVDQSSVKEEEEDYTFRLEEERFLPDQDVRFVVQWDDDKYVASVWCKPDLVIIDRQKPSLCSFLKCQDAAS